MQSEQGQRNGSWLRSRNGLALLVFLGVVGFYLLTEHTAHFFGALPFLLFLLCPLMHVFMHGGHDGHSGHGGQSGAAGPRSDGGER